MIRILVVAALATQASALANAASFVVERISDTQARITMTGTVEFGGNSLIMGSIGAEDGDDLGLETPGGSFQLGGLAPTATRMQSGDSDFEIYFGGVFADGSAASGELLVTLDGPETWRAPGTTGSVNAIEWTGPNGSGSVLRSNVIGTYTIVPEPASAGLLLSAGGTAVISALIRRRLKASR